MKSCRFAVATAALVALSSAASQAQTPPGVPTTQRQPLEVGQERGGSLNEHRAQSWALRGRRGDRVVVDLVSTQFDPQVMVVGPGIQPLEDDDSGGACNARVTFTPPEDGIYWVIVQSAGGGGASGGFILRASRTAGPEATGSCGGESSDRFEAEQVAAIPTSGTLVIGDSVRGELTKQDRSLGDGYARAYDIKGTRGAAATIDLGSRDFDAYLALSGPGLTKPLSDDDGGGGCDARITLTFPADGMYHVVITSADGPETGGFVLRASATPRAVEEHACGGTPDPDHEHGGGISPDELAQLAVQGTIRLGDDIAGELKAETPKLVDGSHALAWSITGKRAETVIVDLVSDEFDGYMLIIGPGLAEALTNDDDGGACNPRIALTFPADGAYRIIVNTIARGTTGKFHLRVSAKPGPVMSGSCEGGRSR